MIRKKRTYPNGTGRPSVSVEITTPIERLATENGGWGYKRIQSELLNSCASAQPAGNRVGLPDGHLTRGPALPASRRLELPVL